MNKQARFASCLLATVMMMSSFSSFESTDILSLNGNTTVVMAAESTVKVLSTVGFAEGMYATWAPVSGASGYNVYVDGVQIDNMLIRQYNGYMRADAVGLKAGSHAMKIVPVINGSEDASKAAQTTASAYAHDRTGFAFVNGSASGAYNNDGTLKSDAVVVYVTEATKDTVSAKLNAGSGVTDVKGIQNIVTAYKKGAEKRPLCLRIIGNITDPANLPNGDLVVDKAKAGMTIEGIGNDAVFNGFGLVLKNSSNVEVRNIGFMNCNSSEGDDCGLQQSNDHIWVHNCDFFYGDAGSDADQAKGDGALDTKTSTYITHSYNHFWDCGKCNLQGMKNETTENYITYHHNWYDHSDSRHPRIRTCSVHIYNNYFDGNAKYGVGVTLGASAFVEGNYFRNCPNPMMSSKQGTDAMGKGTFSGENGGVIKAFGNIIIDAKSYIKHSENNTSFDAYEVSSATEKVPASVKALSGGTIYNNFDTSSVMYSYKADAAKDVPAVVTAKAGRVDGGDFKWTFNNSVDDASDDVNKELKSALVNYKSSIVAIGSGFKADQGTVTPPPSNPTTTASTQATNPPATNPSVPSAGGNAHNFTESGLSSSFFSISGNLSTSKGTVNYGGKTLTQCLKMESATNIAFNASSGGSLTLVFNQPGVAVKVDGTKYTADSNGIVNVNLSAGAHTVTKAEVANLFYMSYSGSGSSTPSVTSAPSVTQAPQSSGTAASTSASSAPVSSPDDAIPSDVKVVSAGGWNEMMYLELSGVSESSVTGVSYSGPTSGSFSAEELEYLVRTVNGHLRVDVTGLKPGSYSLTLTTKSGKITKSSIAVGKQDRSGYAHFNYSDGVGAYNNDGTLKANAKVIYVTDQNKNTVSVTSKDGTTVKGIGHILNSVGKDAGNGLTANAGKANNNSNIIEKLAKDGTPLVVRIIGNVTAPDGLTAYDSLDFGGSVGDNGYMARLQSGKDVTIEGIGTDACMNGWGVHFVAQSSNPTLGKSFEVRNIAFRNVPEDCIGMEGVQSGSSLSAPVERCWIHNCEFYAPKIANPAESDKDGGDGACDFKRGMYFTNSYCYYEGYHKTNLVGASDSNMQYHLTYHHNYWKNCESRGPLARQANIHMYNNVFEGQTSYCMNPRANAYIFSEYNVFDSCKDPMEIKSGGIKSYKDVFINCKGAQDGTIVNSKSDKVASGCKYENFDTDSSVSYIPSNGYVLSTDTSSLKSLLSAQSGVMKNSSGSSSGGLDIEPVVTTVTTTPAPVTTTSQTTAGSVVSQQTRGDIDASGVVDLSDLSSLAVYLLEHKGLTDEQLRSADTTGDGNVNLSDLARLRQFISKKIDSL